MTEPANWRKRDHLAEFWVAGKLVDAGWNVYFPHRDKGFDLIAVREVAGHHHLRPVQVKGKYPMAGTGNRRLYGYRGKLTATHPDMILAIPFFSCANGPRPEHVAWLPFEKIALMSGERHRCEPAKLIDGMPQPRQEYRSYFDSQGFERLVDVAGVTPVEVC